MTADAPLVLGIETSCDETGVGLVRGNTLLADAVASSVEEHARFGGVVPEVASRAHLEAMVPTIERACETAGVGLDDIDAIAVTSGPGLAGALLVGVAAATPTSNAPARPGPLVTAIASTSCSSTPAVSQARSIVGTIASRWARLATSGTTPPNLECSSTLLATASASSVWPRTMPTPVSSHDVSMPRTSGASVMSVIVPGTMSSCVSWVPRSSATCRSCATSSIPTWCWARGGSTRRWRWCRVGRSPSRR